MAKLIGAGVIAAAFIVAAPQVPFVVSLVLVVMAAVVVLSVLLDWAAGCQVVYEQEDRSEEL